MKMKFAQCGLPARLAAVLMLLFFSFSSVNAGDESAGEDAKVSDVFATVNGEVITSSTFHAFLMGGVRERFYHGNVTVEEQVAFRSEMAQKMVDRVLLLQEAHKRKIVVKAINLEKEDRQQQTAQLNEDAILDRLKAEIGDTLKVTEAEVREYYAANPKKFTRPGQVRVSLILLAVPPYATPAVWQGKMVEAESIAERLKQGEAFASLAKQFSDHKSASAGGDLGTVHAGMLARDVEQLLEGLSPGENAAPIFLLQGVALFRLDERIAAELNPYDRVASRARNLLLRARGEEAWQALLAQLRAVSEVHIMTAGSGD